MVDVKRHTPTNKRFQKYTQSFVEGKTMKGNLNKGDKDKNSYKVTGILEKIHSKGLDSNGWYVKINKKTLQCYYGDNIIYLPPYTVNGDWYIPKSKCEVEVSINEKSNIFTITRIKDPNKKPIAMDNDGVRLAGSGIGAIRVAKNIVQAVGEHLAVQNEIVVDTTDDKDLPDQIKITDMYKEIQELKKKVSDSDASGE